MATKRSRPLGDSLKTKCDNPSKRRRKRSGNASPRVNETPDGFKPTPEPPSPPPPPGPTSSRSEFSIDALAAVADALLSRSGPAIGTGSFPYTHAQLPSPEPPSQPPPPGPTSSRSEFSIDALAAVADARLSRSGPATRTGPFNYTHVQLPSPAPLLAQTGRTLGPAAMGVPFLPWPARPALPPGPNSSIDPRANVVNPAISRSGPTGWRVPFPPMLAPPPPRESLIAHTGPAVVDSTSRRAYATRHIHPPSTGTSYPPAVRQNAPATSPFESYIFETRESNFQSWPPSPNTNINLPNASLRNYPAITNSQAASQSVHLSMTPESLAETPRLPTIMQRRRPALHTEPSRPQTANPLPLHSSIYPQPILSDIRQQPMDPSSTRTIPTEPKYLGSLPQSNTPSILSPVPNISKHPTNAKVDPLKTLNRPIPTSSFQRDSGVMSGRKTTKRTKRTRRIADADDSHLDPNDEKRHGGCQ